MRSQPPSDAAKAIEEKLDRLDEAFLFECSIDIETYDRHAEKLREELTLPRSDRPSGQREKLDVEGILAFAERVLPRAATRWLGAVYPERMIRVINMGVSGNTTRDLKARWQRDVLDLKPDWLSIMIGANDVWRQYDSPP